MAHDFTESDFADTKQPITFSEDDFNDAAKSFKLSPDQIRNESSFQPSQFSSGGGNLNPADNPDFDFTRAVANNPVGFVKQVPAAVLKKAGDVVRGSAADLVSTAFQEPEYGGNLKAATDPFNDKPLPVDAFINSAAATNPNLATTANVGQGIAGTAPLLLAGGLPSVVQKAAALGFSADMISNVGKLATDYGTEVGKPKDQQDPAKIAQLQSDLIQTGIFAPLAGAHGAGDFVSGKVEPVAAASRAASKIVDETPFQPKIESPLFEQDAVRQPAPAPSPAPDVTPENAPSEPSQQKVTFIGQQEGFGPIPPMNYYNISKDIVAPDGTVLHTAGSTLAEPTLRKYGIPIPETASEPVTEAPQNQNEEQKPETSAHPNELAIPAKEVSIPAEIPPASAPVQSASGEPSLNSPTAMKYRQIDQERAARGLEPLTKPIGVSDQATMNRAMAEVDKNPDSSENLVSELNKKPRTIEDWENHVLLLRKIDLRNQYDQAASDIVKANESGDDSDLMGATLRRDNASNKLTDLENASRVSGSARGRALRSLQVMANEDYSLASLETQRRAAKGGAPLTNSERTELKKTADDYKKANDELTAHLSDARNKISALEANKSLDAVQSDPKIEPHILGIARKISDAFDKQAEAALNRIKQRRSEGRLFTGIDPTELADYAIYGASKIAKGVTDSAEWSAAMVKDFGDSIKPHLDQIFSESKRRFGNLIRSSTRPETEAKVRKTISSLNPEQQIARVENTIKERLASGEKDNITPQVQKLSRLLVQGGIKDRNALIDAVHSVLKESDPEITRRDAMDAISGYGDFKPLTKDEVSIQLRGMKGEMQQIAKLEDMAEGIPPSKTGVERRTPTDAERKLIKAVNEAKIKFQVPITDPTTQLKSALDTRKIQLQRQIEDMQERMASKDFAKPPKRELVLDRRAQELQAQKERVIKKFKREQTNYQNANRPKIQKAFDFLSNIRRFSVLSGVSVLGKLAAYSATKLPTIAATEGIGGALSKLPVIGDISKRAPSEGGYDHAALVSSIASAVTKGFKDAYDTATKGQSDLRAAFSNRVESGHEWYNFFQTIHEIIKSPLRRAAFELSLKKRMAYADAHGADITDPMTILALSKDAFLDSDRALLLENNRLASGIRGLFKQLEAPNKKTGKVPYGGKTLATLGRIESPVLSVPLNYAKQTLMAAFGLITGSAKAGIAWKNGIDKLRPEEADEILRHLKYGTIGGAALLYGFYDGYHNGVNGTFGGYYQRGEKRKPEQAGVNGIKIGTHKIPGLILHNPILAVAQLGHTIGAIAASKLNKNNPEKKGILAGTAAGLFGLINESPIGNSADLINQLKNASSVNSGLENHVKNLVVPTLSNEIATLTDKDARGNTVKRAPDGFIQSIETGIPVLRKNVPVSRK